MATGAVCSLPQSGIEHQQRTLGGIVQPIKPLVMAASGSSMLPGNVVLLDGIEQVVRQHPQHPVDAAHLLGRIGQEWNNSTGWPWIGPGAEAHQGINGV